MSTAFVLSGGGSLGAVQVGMLLALAEQGIEPELLVGTSVGAINAAWIAGLPGLEGAQRLAEVWKSVRREEIFPPRPIVGLFGFLGFHNYLVSSAALRSLLGKYLTYENLEDARVPIKVVATEITTGLEVVLSSGNAVDAVSASTAIPGVFPPVIIGDHHLIDGGVTDNTPIAHAVKSGATTIYVLSTGYTCSATEPPRSALGVALRAITFMVQQRLVADIDRYQESVDLRVIPPPCPLRVSPADFSHSTALINESHELTLNWLMDPASGAGQSSSLAIHSH